MSMMDERIFCGPRKRGKRKGKKGRNTLARVQSSPSTQSLVLATTTCEFRESKKRVKSDNSNNVGMNKGNEIKFLLVRERVEENNC